VSSKFLGELFSINPQGKMEKQQMGDKVNGLGAVYLGLEGIPELKSRKLDLRVDYQTQK